MICIIYHFMKFFGGKESLFIFMIYLFYPNVLFQPALYHNLLMNNAYQDYCVFLL